MVNLTYNNNSLPYDMYLGCDCYDNNKYSLSDLELDIINISSTNKLYIGDIESQTAYISNIYILIIIINISYKYLYLSLLSDD